MVPVLPARSQLPNFRLPPVPPGCMTALSTRFTPSATHGSIACLHDSPGVAIDLPVWSWIDVTSSGAQYTPRAANVAYASDSINGVTYPTPSVNDTTWSSGCSVCALYMPSF